MKRISALFLGSFRLIRRDPMLLLLLFAPLLAGAAFFFGLPFLARLLISRFSFDLTVWYPLADMMLLMLTPMLGGVLSGFLMLDERDEGVGEYYGVTPLGGGAYLFSRLALPMLWSIVIAPAIIMLFSLSHPDLARVLAISAVGGLFGASLALMLTAFAGNKVEGLAVSKIMGLLMMPMLVPFITDSPWAVAAGVFPSYWMGALMRGSLWQLPAGIAVSAIWLGLLFLRTGRRTK